MQAEEAESDTVLGDQLSLMSPLKCVQIKTSWLVVGRSVPATEWLHVATAVEGSLHECRTP